MSVSVGLYAYIALLVLVGAGRLAELRISRRNQQRLAARGARKLPEPAFHRMVVVHTAVIIGAGAEVLALHRPFLPLLGWPMLFIFLVAALLRWWVIVSLAAHWNVQVVASAPLGVVSSGPYRWVRHPNYAAVFLELVALPLIHTAWLTALLGTSANLWVLHRRIALEDEMLLSHPQYRAIMGHKPRFFPDLFSRRPSGKPLASVPHVKDNS